MNSLEIVNLHNCTSLASLPASFGSLSGLQSLSLKACAGLTDLPDCLGRLSNLRQLDLTRCKNLESLPDSFGSLGSLCELSKSECKKLKALPDSFGSLSSLRQLDLRQTWYLKRLPKSFSRQIRLQRLHAFNCFAMSDLLQCCSSLRSLTLLQLGISTTALPLEGIQSLPNLMRLCIAYYPSRTENLAGFDALSSRLQLRLSQYDLIALPDSMCSLTHLRVLSLSTPRLKALPSTFGFLNSLRYLDMHNCELYHRACAA